jgi:hypothetical protein
MTPTIRKRYVRLRMFAPDAPLESGSTFEHRGMSDKVVAR